MGLSWDCRISTTVNGYSAFSCQLLSTAVPGVTLFLFINVYLESRANNPGWFSLKTLEPGTTELNLRSYGARHPFGSTHYPSAFAICGIAYPKRLYRHPPYSPSKGASTKCFQDLCPLTSTKTGSAITSDVISPRASCQITFKTFKFQISKCSGVPCRELTRTNFRFLAARCTAAFFPTKGGNSPTKGGK